MYISRLFGCIPLGFIAPWLYGLAALFARLSRAPLFALLDTQPPSCRAAATTACVAAVDGACCS